MALSLEDCDRMVAAAQQAGRMLMIAHVLPFLPEFDFLWKAVQDGRYGKLLGGQFRRVISNPEWLPDFYNPQKVGGPMIDLHVHDAHFIRLLFGMPKRVISSGRMRGEVAEFFQSIFDFEDQQLSVAATSGCIMQQGREFTHGYEAHFEKATIAYDFAGIKDHPQLLPLTVLTEDGGVERPELGSGDTVDAFVSELTEATQAISSGTPSPLLAGDLARDAILLCQRQTQSMATGQPVSV